ncbi:MAG: ATP-binding cassette domain-containing protein [Pseudomonadota bacterium]
MRLEHLTLDLPAARTVADVSAAAGELGGRLTRSGSRVTGVRVLDDVSLAIGPGTCVGVIGLNGSGKSSLLRVIAGIYTPTSGTSRVSGRVATLFSNQLGMNPNATGAENVRLLSLLLGLDQSGVDALIDDVATFSELEEFMQLPVRTYSAGMRTRIGFGVATSVQPDVLLIDEVFGTGDQSFVHKARARLEQLIARSGVVVLSSHSAELMSAYASQLVWMHRGQVRRFGPLPEVLHEYHRYIRETRQARQGAGTRLR